MKQISRSMSVRYSAGMNSQSGNVLFYILIAVALLAALSFAVSQGGRGSVETLSEDRARLYASEILEYANNVGSAVAQIRLRGFSDEQISFENPVVSGYTNGNCTSDECKVFHPSGGGMSWMTPAAEMNDGSDWFISGDSCVNSIGTGYSGACNSSDESVFELIMFLPNLDLNVCLQINEFLDIDAVSGSPPTEAGNAYNSGAGKFTGTFQDVNNYEITGTFKGVKTGCFEGGGAFPAPGTYHFYRVLIAR